MFREPKGVNAADGDIRFSIVVCAVVDTVAVVDVLVGGAALVVVVVIVVVSSPSFILDIMFKSSVSVGATIVPCVVEVSVEVSVIVSVETRFSFMSTVVVVISDVDPTEVVSSDCDDASVEVV